MTEKVKEKLITVRVAESKHAEFKVAADLRGATMSSLIHQFIVQVIREEKRQHPEAFAELDASAIQEPRPSPAKITQSTPQKGDWIDEALDTAYTFGGKPLSDKAKEQIRQILEAEKDRFIKD